jgi:hypothetical protein
VVQVKQDASYTLIATSRAEYNTGAHEETEKPVVRTIDIRVVARTT